ncbi:hypothetical protein LEM8419_00896 [Neolewinella maritima]|uniref:Uncharacterized protein n=1 Tax=Neolewinella maritima TaxID=1383882 RepID=A0ABN8F6A4_9BACT|nr:hypothetical protein [Neolewinella maritima]CAH0999596.1 hypothetical protein LEM8419_00896 [Neolewinella maritima]
MTDTHTFAITPVSSESIGELPGDWTTDDYRKLLELTDYGDASELSDKEVQEMAFMSIADLEKPEAADLLMKYVFPEDALTPGQRQNSSHEMDTERLWEEYPEPVHHRNFFRVGTLLYAAYNGGHPKPDGREVVFTVTAKDEEGAKRLQNPKAALLLRLMAPAMDGHALLHRLYEDELKSGEFAAAKNLLYQIKSEPQGERSFRITVYSTDYWLEDFVPAGPYEVTL